MKKIFQGLLISIANAIPGVSGATMAVVFGAYDDLINLLSKPYSFKILKKNFFLVFGMVLGTVFSVFGLTILFSCYPLLMTCYFLGLVFSGTWIEAKSVRSVTFRSGVLFALGVLIILGIEWLAGGKRDEAVSIFWLISGGVLTGIVIVLPGVSASLTLMALNLFFPLVKMAEEFLKSSLAFSFPSVKTVFSLGTFGLSLGIGTILFARIMKGIIKRHPEELTVFSLGLISGSIGSVIAKLPLDGQIWAVPLEIGLGVGLGIFTLFLLNRLIKRPPKHLG